MLAPGRRLLLFYEYVDQMLERRAPHRDRHLEWVGRWRDDGRLAAAGAIGDPPSGALFIFEVDDPGVVEEFVGADPYVDAGLVVSWRTEPWSVV